MDYHRYLASREWALRRAAIRRRARGKCERCHYHKMDAVHHLTYERVGHEPLSDLMAICDGCHKFVSAESDQDPKVILESRVREIICDAFKRSRVTLDGPLP